MIQTIKKSFFLFAYMWILYPISVFAGPAENYVPLTEGGIPQVNDLNSMSMTELLNTFFAVSVGVAAVLAVIMIAVGGFRYMTSESMFKTSGAKEQIINAIIGLVIVLSAILILSVINPDIVSLRLFNM